MKKWFSELSSISKLSLYGILFLITFFSFEGYHMYKFDTVLNKYESDVYSYNKTLGDIADSREVTDEQKVEIDRVIHMLDDADVLETLSRSREVVLFDDVLSGKMDNASDGKYVTLAGGVDSTLAYKYADGKRYESMSVIYRGALLGLLVSYVVLEIFEAVSMIRGDIRAFGISKSEAVDVGKELKVLREILDKGTEDASSKEEFDVAVKQFIDKIDGSAPGNGSESRQVVFRK